MTDYRDKQIVIVGAGTSGRGLARFFVDRGARVVLSDVRSADVIDGLDSLAESGVNLDLGEHTVALFTAADLVVVSPGVPLNIPVLARTLELGIPVLGEIEIAWREMSAPLIGITGTNGKSTVTTLVGEMFRQWGKQVFVGGNLGTPLIDAVGKSWDWLVVELSSFQLEAIAEFRPDYGILLNITEDHLDRYPDMANYQAAKLRLFENMGAEEVAILNWEDPLVREAAATLAPRIVWFSSENLLDEGMGLADAEIVWRWQEEEVRFPIGQLQIRGQHNLENVMAAMISVLLEGCPPEVAWAAAASFRGLPHRMELVGEVNGVRWYDDSKGTNIGSVVKSLAGLDAPVTLIAGGKDKRGDLSPLNEQLAAKVESLILIGEAAGRMAAAFADLTRVHRAGDMAEAVQMAAELTEPGGVVLLSPGCSSFDMFRSYEERGNIFAAAFRALNPTSRHSHGS